MKKKLIAIGVIIMSMLMLVAFSACSSLDVVGKESVTSFERVLNALPDGVRSDEANGGFSLSAPDGTARFIWSKDYSKSPLHDVMLELDVQPFIDAGLDPAQLPENYAAYEDQLMVGTKIGDDSLKYDGDATPLAAYEQISDKYGDTIGFHTALDHFNVDLGDGNLFEWAKDFSENTSTKEDQDKDIVFVLNPEPLIEAGVNPESVEGWVYAPVTVDIDGKATEVNKFLKPFNLE